MSVILKELETLNQQQKKEIANIGFFGDLDKKWEPIQDRIDGKHEFSVWLTTANHKHALTERQQKMIDDPYIPFEEMSFLYNVDTVRCRSFLGCWIGGLKSSLAGGVAEIDKVYGFKNVGDTVLILDLNKTTLSWQIVPDAATAANGIVVGTSTTAVSLSDNDLTTRIAHGTSAGQLLYGGTSISAIKVDATETAFRVSRSLGNVSTGTITVNEVGLIVEMGVDSPTSSEFMIEKTLSTKAILDGEHGLFAYTFKVTI